MDYRWALLSHPGQGAAVRGHGQGYGQRHGPRYGHGEPAVVTFNPDPTVRPPPVPLPPVHPDERDILMAMEAAAALRKLTEQRMMARRRRQTWVDSAALERTLSRERRDR